ncbi:GspE/PulE family protein [Aminiphilus circumscriptus]|uniref:GspE/PulE family protein n=1 Tax=Aminiphilus circumscriptus TaxID=290732 RepID=UPI00049239EC|nr:ATPase, T2SS/T4P/T4SS family [Aminiphilus circumscriptus]
MTETTKTFSQEKRAVTAEGASAASSAPMSLPGPEQIRALLPPSLSLDSLRQFGILPIRTSGDLLVVAISSLEQYATAQILGAFLNRSVEVELHPQERIAELIRALYDMRSSLGEETTGAIEAVEDLSDLVREDVLSDSVDAPVIRLVNGVIQEAIRERATDIHIEPFEDSLVIRYRIDGVLLEKLRLPKGHQAPLTSRIKVMARMDIAERFVPQDGRIGISLGDRDVDIRVGSVPTQHGERLALRILDKAQGLLSLEDLGMAEEERTSLESLIARPYGMILLTGPTGSGKTTTLYAMLRTLARPEVNVITVEDPVEYDLPGVAQIQVNEKAGVTFASALRSILRQDPDIVMVGEMRDFETAHIGVQASLTGHLVLSTLHTNDSTSAVTRLTDMGIEPYLVSGSLIGVVAQRLVRRICPKCREEAAVPSLLARRGLEKAWRGHGCDHCRNTGYRGRVGLYEQFVVDGEMQEAIAASRPGGALRTLAREKGLRTLWELGFAKVSAGLTTPEELLRVAGEG